MYFTHVVHLYSDPAVFQVLNNHMASGCLYWTDKPYKFIKAMEDHELVLIFHTMARDYSGCDA